MTLIGAGLGGPDLITVRGWRALHAADVVVADRLADPGLIRELRPGVLLIDAGKAPGVQQLSQDQINRLLVEHAHACRAGAAQGRRPVRVRPGRRGGRRLRRLRHPLHGDPRAVQRDRRARPGRDPAHPPRARPVILRGLRAPPARAPGQPGELARAGRRAGHPGPADGGAQPAGHRGVPDRLRPGETTPAACVERAGTARQRVHRGTLAELAHPDKAPKISNPAVIVIGPTAGDLGLIRPA